MRRPASTKEAVCTVSTVCSILEEWAPQQWAYDWDRVGLAVGAPDTVVKTVLVCLTPNRGALSAAQECAAPLVVSHHPLIWTPLASLRSDDSHAALCLDFARAGIACYSLHTNLDVAQRGTSWSLAQALDLQDTAPLFSVPQARQLKLVTFVPESHLPAIQDALADAGAGKIGDYTHCSFRVAGVGSFKPGPGARPYSGAKGTLNEEPELRLETLLPAARAGAVVAALRHAHPYEEVAFDLVPMENPDKRAGLGVAGSLEAPCLLKEFAASVRERLGLSALRVVGDPDKRVRRIAVMGGAGGSEILRMSPEIDVYVTGDVKYHDADAAMERGLAVIDAGHAGTEMVVLPRVAAFLREKLPHLTVHVYREPELFRTIH